MNDKIKLHLGCGKRDFGSDWVHIDGSDFPHVSSHDIVDLPFNKNSVDLIYASHVLEYFDRKQGDEVLSKWYSILKNGGTLRLAVPDFETIAELYHSKKYDLNSFIGLLYGKMKMSDQSIYHKTVYDFNGLRKKLTLVGFYSIKRYNWRDTEHSHVDDHSQAYLPHMNKETGTLISLNIEAVK
jgi:predicted SAM-dependent methyltransferase